MSKITLPDKKSKTSHGKSIDQKLINGILSQMERLGCVEVEKRESTWHYRWCGDEERAQRTLRALVRHHIFQFGPVTQEAIQAALALDQGEVGPILEDLVAHHEVLCSGEDAACLYRCDGLDLGPPSPETLDAAFLDHFQAMTLALTDKLTCNINPDLPPVGGSTYTLELWPGHPFEARARETFERCRHDLSRLRQELQQVRGLLQAHGPSPDPSQRYTLKMYIGQHVQGAHNLSHIQGDLCNDSHDNETPPEARDAVASAAAPQPRPRGRRAR